MSSLSWAINSFISSLDGSLRCPAMSAAYHLDCISAVVWTGPSGWTRPISARVWGCLRSGLNMFLNKWTSLLVGAMMDESTKGNFIRYPVARITSSQRNSSSLPSKINPSSVNRLMFGLTITLPLKTWLGSASLMVGCCSVTECLGFKWYRSWSKVELRMNSHILSLHALGRSPLNQLHARVE